MGKTLATHRNNQACVRVRRWCHDPFLTIRPSPMDVVLQIRQTTMVRLRELAPFGMELRVEYCLPYPVISLKQLVGQRSVL